MKIKKMKLLIIDDDNLCTSEITNIELIKNNMSKGIFLDDVVIPSVLENILFTKNYIKDPYYSDNIFSIKEFETYHQFYFCYFDGNFKDPELIFDGVDTIADVYVNNKKILHLNNMFIEQKTSLFNLNNKNNELVIHIYPSLIEGKKYEKVPSSPYMCEELMHIRKKVSSFGWDILPRTPLGGIYKDIRIDEKHYGIDNVYLYSNKNKLFIDIELINDSYDGCYFFVDGSCKDSFFKFSRIVKEKKNHFEIDLKDVKYWNAIGYGKPFLYNISISLMKDNTVIDTKKLKFGFRDIELKRTSIVEENGCFEFIINNQKNFILGTNWVPIDAIKSYDKERMYKALDELIEIGCNAVRCWGGSIYEIDEFYDYCDEHGILVWQDFMMACGTYPQDESFKKQIEIESEFIIKRLRNHPSIILWAGDNECDYMFLEHANLDPNINNMITRKTLKDAVKKYDFKRDYIPSSPYIDEVAARYFKIKQTAEDHIWGPRDYFRSDYYKNANCYFASEIGYHGCSSPKALDKFLKNPYPLFEKNDIPTREYLAHASAIVDNMSSQYAYRIKLMCDQVKTLFINNFDNIIDFSKASQISQAEAMKYFIEKFRINRNTHGGIIWWNLIDGWPQISDSVIDYSFVRKLAFYFIQRSQNKTLLALREDNDEIELYFINDLEIDQSIKYQVIDGKTNSVILNGEALNKKYHSKKISSFTFDKNNQDFFILKWLTSDNNEHINHYVTNIKNMDYNLYINILNKYNLLNFDGYYDE